MIIVCICCLVLWKLYDALTEDFNYLGVVDSPSVLGKFKNYAISTDAKPCAVIGKSLLAKGGSAVDAAIGTLVCMGLALPNSLGLGGGCLMTIYERKTKKATVIDGREVAPAFATEQMFAQDPGSASRGPLSVGVPGEIAAHWKAHQMFGKLNWSQLFEDNILLAETGTPVVMHLGAALKNAEHSQYISPPLAALFTNPETGEFYKEGEIMAQKQLAETLRQLSAKGAGEFYGGPLGQKFVEDLQKQGGNITIEDLTNYEALVKEPLAVELADDLHLYTQPLPGSGIVLSMILRLMKQLGYYKNIKPQSNPESAGLYFHRLAESLKFAYAQRAGLEDKPDDPGRLEQLIAKITSDEFIQSTVAKIDNTTHPSSYYGGLDFFTDDHGTAHVSVLDAEGNAVAVTSSVNLYFGSGLISPSTGIIYNDVMDDFVSPNITNKFNLPPSAYNRIRPGRRPLSSMSPSVFTNKEGDVRLVIGASGGTLITSSIALASLRYCFIGEDIKTAIDAPRIHHQFLPDQVSYESNFPKDILHSLAQRGHQLKPITGRSSVVMAVANNSNLITANSDYRKGGSVDGL